jgi:hypothetical protein
VNSRGAGGDIDPGQFMSEVLNMPLDWPWKRVELGHLSHHRYRQRPLSRNVAIAELYHENSKLYAERLPELAAGLIDPEALRSEFVRRRSVGHVGEHLRALELEARHRSILARAGSPEATLSYAVELRVLCGDEIGLHEPITNTLPIVKRLTEGDLGELSEALHLVVGTGEPLPDGPIVFVIGCFARNDVLWGPRGYRRTLMDAGMQAGRVLEAARQSGLSPRAIYEFDDHRVDAALDVDGVEEGTLVAIELEVGVGNN